MRHIKGQAALEYLSTYGWAILLIAIALGTLYTLGFFNGLSFAPTVHPGACSVVTPFGSYTARYVSLQGNCNSGLPEYVAAFDGKDSVITIPASIGLSPSSFTVTGWIELNSNASWNMFFKSYVGSDAGYYVFGDAVNHNGYIYYNGNIVAKGPATQIAGEYSSNSVAFQEPSFIGALEPGNWYFLGVTFNSTTNTMITYLDGKYAGSAVFPPSINYFSTPSNLYIGNNSNYFAGHPYTWEPGRTSTYYTNGSISNIQFYNQTLDAATIQSLYFEGIGGSPIDLSSLVGWWPLNGNAKDYSGDGNDARPSNVIYTSAWQSDYVAP